MEKANKKKILVIAIAVVILAIAVMIPVSNIKVPLMDIDPAEHILYGAPLQMFGIECTVEYHDTDESIPEGIDRLYVPLKDYFKAEKAIKSAHAMMGIINDLLYSFGDNVGLTNK